MFIRLPSSVIAGRRCRPAKSRCDRATQSLLLPEEPRPILRGVQNSQDEDGVLNRTVEEQIITKARHYEPAYVSVARTGFKDAPPDLDVARQEISRIEKSLPDSLGSLGVLGGNINP